MTHDWAGLVGADVTPRISGVSAPMRPPVFRVEAQLPELSLVILANVFSSCLRGGRKVSAQKASVSLLMAGLPLIT